MPTGNNTGPQPSTPPSLGWNNFRPSSQTPLSAWNNNRPGWRSGSPRPQSPQPSTWNDGGPRYQTQSPGPHPPFDPTGYGRGSDNRPPSYGHGAGNTSSLRHYQASMPTGNNTGPQPSTPPSLDWNNFRLSSQTPLSGWNDNRPGWRSSSPRPQSPQPSTRNDGGPRYRTQSPGPHSPFDPTGYGRGSDNRPPSYGRGAGNTSSGFSRGNFNRYDGPPPSLSPNFGCGRPRGRCHICGTPGCRSVLHEREEEFEVHRYGPPRARSGSPAPSTQGNGYRSSPSGDRTPPDNHRPQSI